MMIILDQSVQSPINPITIHQQRFRSHRWEAAATADDDSHRAPQMVLKCEVSDFFDPSQQLDQDGSYNLHIIYNWWWLMDCNTYIYVYNTSYSPQYIIFSRMIKMDQVQSTPIYTIKKNTRTYGTDIESTSNSSNIRFFLVSQKISKHVASGPEHPMKESDESDFNWWTPIHIFQQYISIHNDLGISIWDLMWDFSMHLKSLDKFRHSAPVPLPKAPTSSCSNLHLGSMSAWGWWLHRKWNPHDFLLTSQIFLKQSLRACWCPSLVGYNVYIPSINPIVSLVPSKTSSKGNRKGNHGFTPQILGMSCWISLQPILQLIQYTSRYPLLPFNTLTWLPKPSSLLVE